MVKPCLKTKVLKKCLQVLDVSFQCFAGSGALLIYENAVIGPECLSCDFCCLEHYGVHVPVECTMGLSCQVYLGFSLLIK